MKSRADRQRPFVRRLSSRRLVAVLLVQLIITLNASGTTAQAVDSELAALSQTEVSALSKFPQRRFGSAGAVHIIDQDDIRRSGARSLPELLRQVPGIHIARIDAQTWAVGVRGFASRLSRGLLVLMDGRSVYSPLFGGVYWEELQVPLDEIERIEVVLGPGGAVWGANAINGVINVITKAALTNPGSALRAGAGSQDQIDSGISSQRYLNDQTAIRLFARYNKRGALDDSHASADYDQSSLRSAGFRLDSEHANQAYTLQGDVYQGRLGVLNQHTFFSPAMTAQIADTAHLTGGNLLTRWESNRSALERWKLQLYYDHHQRDETVYQTQRNTLDIDFNYQRQWLDWVWITAGSGLRYLHSHFSSEPFLHARHPKRTDRLYHGHLSALLSIVPDRVTFTPGIKIEHNAYTGWEYQPSAQLTYQIDPHNVAWLSLTRAVRTPSQVEHDISIYGLLDADAPLFGALIASRQFRSEKIISWEGGFRSQLNASMALDLALFANRYPNFLSLEPGTAELGTLPDGSMSTLIPFQINNGLSVDSQGGEVVFEWLPALPFRLTAHYSYININARPRAASQDLNSAHQLENNTPVQQAMLSLGWEPDLRSSYSLQTRFVDKVPGMQLKSSFSSSLVIRVRPVEDWEWLVTVDNILSSNQPQYRSGNVAFQARRSIFMRWTWLW